jgi:DNA-binding NtrC family response regulator
METLVAWNYDVSFAEDGDKALDLLGSLQPHALLCGLRMPRCKGLDLLAAMKERGLNIATLMISGVGQIDDAVRGIKLGAYDYLTKPVDLDRLEILLKNLTSHVKLSEEINACAATSSTPASSARLSAARCRCAVLWP